MRPLLGHPIEKAKLLWAATIVVAKERGCSVDGKLVSRVVKDYQEGKLSRQVALAEALLCCNRTSENVNDNQAENTNAGAQNGIRKQDRNRLWNNISGRRIQQAQQPEHPAEFNMLTHGKLNSSRQVANEPNSRQNDLQAHKEGTTPVAPVDKPKSSSKCTSVPSCLLKRRRSAKQHSSGTGDGRIMSMVEQIASLVSSLAQSWGFADIAAGIGLPSEYCTHSTITNNNNGCDHLEGSHQNKTMGFIPNSWHQETSRSGKAQEHEQDNKLTDTLQKTVMQLVLMGHRLGDPSCLWNLWGPSWVDRNCLAMNADQQRWFDSYGVTSSCRREIAAIPSGYIPPMVPSAVIPSHIGLTCEGPMVKDYQALAGQKWTPISDHAEQHVGMDEIERVKGHQQTSKSIKIEKERCDPHQGTANGAVKASDMQKFKKNIPDECTVCRSQPKRASRPTVSSSKRVKVMRTSPTSKEHSHQACKGDVGDCGQSGDQEKIEMAVAEALVCMSHQIPR